MDALNPVSGITNAQVLGPDFTFHTSPALYWEAGTFSASGSATNLLPGENTWVIPGLVDSHVHLAWTDFGESERNQRAQADRDQLIQLALAKTLAAGFTSARDAGGLETAWVEKLASGHILGPAVSPSVALITREDAQRCGTVGSAVEDALDRGAQWIKLIGTDGVTSPEGQDFEAHFTAAQFQEATRLAHQAGARVMVHAWGGQAITWALEAGVESIEHGIFLTRDQAELAAHTSATFVPTLVIYRLVLAMIEKGKLPRSFLQRVQHAVHAHPAAVRTARDAGVHIALGTDFGTMDQHGSNARELLALIDAGLTPTEALRAATSAGARLVNLNQTGTIETGAPADAVVLRYNPLNPTTFAQADAIVAVIKSGRMVSNQLQPRISN